MIEKFPNMESRRVIAARRAGDEDAGKDNWEFRVGIDGDGVIGRRAAVHRHLHLLRVGADVGEPHVSSGMARVGRDPLCDWRGVRRHWRARARAAGAVDPGMEL